MATQVLDVDPRALHVPPARMSGADYNGVTRATRIAMLAPGSLIRIEVVGTLTGPVGHLPTIGDLIP